MTTQRDTETNEAHRERMSEARMRELLAEGRRVREAVEKDIAEMRRIPADEAAALVR
jgi:hypothetical protein